MQRSLEDLNLYCRCLNMFVNQLIDISLQVLLLFKVKSDSFEVNNTSDFTFICSFDNQHPVVEFLLNLFFGVKILHVFLLSPDHIFFFSVFTVLSENRGQTVFLVKHWFNLVVVVAAVHI